MEGPLVERLGQVLQEAGSTWGAVAGCISEEGVAPSHFAGLRLEKLIGLSLEVGQRVQLFVASIVAGARRRLQLPAHLPGRCGSGGHTRLWGICAGGALVHLCRHVALGSQRVGAVTECTSRRLSPACCAGFYREFEPGDLGNSSPAVGAFTTEPCGASVEGGAWTRDPQMRSHLVHLQIPVG
eukprot:gene5523-biopygen5531